ncbi:MAG: TauD/TfdA family dioxygenase [Rhodospirillales bacterium]
MNTPKPKENPFAPGDAAAYIRWRDWKLENQPQVAASLVVDVADPFNMTPAEHGALLDRLRACNMAVYALVKTDAPADEIIRTIAGRFGLFEPDRHLCAEEDGITPLSAVEAGERKRYIPYTDNPINWHTDGYYNEPGQRVRAFMLHCVSQASKGGDSAVMDPEIAYIRLRDENPEYISALKKPQAMTIPANEENGVEIRGPVTGPVFFVDPSDGALQMRYTARGRNIEWADDAATHDAVRALARVMDAGTPDIIRFRLKPGQGIICNNVLHARTGFDDDKENNQKRLVYRGRFYDRIAE